MVANVGWPNKIKLAISISKTRVDFSLICSNDFEIEKYGLLQNCQRWLKFLFVSKGCSDE